MTMIIVMCKNNYTSSKERKGKQLHHASVAQNISALRKQNKSLAIVYLSKNKRKKPEEKSSSLYTSSPLAQNLTINKSRKIHQRNFFRLPISAGEGTSLIVH
jgi:hypothetical protein